jgi:O-antigen/teichoic acid export membrane protein
MAGITGRLVKGSVWLSSARAIDNILATVSTFVLARYLQPADFGLVALGTTMLMIITAVTNLSLSEALIRHEDPGESHFSAVFTLNAARGLILALILAVAAYPMALFYVQPRLVGVMLALSLSLFMRGITNPRRVMLRRALVFHQEFTLIVSQKFFGVVASIVVAVVYESYWALIVGILVTQFANIIVSYMVLPFWPRITFQHMRELLSFSGWLTAGQVVNQLNWRFDILLIGKLLDATALGYYTLGSQLAQLPTREAIAPLTQTIYPGFAKIRNDPVRIAAAYQRVQALVTAIALPAGIGVAVIADPLVRLTLGEKWAPVIFIIQSLASVFALQTLGSLVQPLGMAKGETRLLFIRDMQMLIFRVPIIALALIFYGLTGVVLARIVTGLFGAFVNMILIRRLIGVTVIKQLAANLRALIAVGGMAAGVTLALREMAYTTDHVILVMQIGILVTLGAIIYCTATMALWLAMNRPSGPETEIVNLLSKVRSKLRPA